MKYLQSLIITISRNWYHLGIILIISGLAIWIVLSGLSGCKFSSKIFSYEKTIPEFPKLKSEVKR